MKSKHFLILFALLLAAIISIFFIPKNLNHSDNPEKVDANKKPNAHISIEKEKGLENNPNVENKGLDSSPINKEAKIAEIKNDFTSKRLKLLEMLPSSDNKVKLNKQIRDLERAEIAALAEYMSHEELRQFELTESHSAKKLRILLNDVGLNENHESWGLIYDRYRNEIDFVDKFYDGDFITAKVPGSDGRFSEIQKPYLAEDFEFRKNLKSELSDEAYKEYSFALNYGNKVAGLIAEKTGVNEADLASAMMYTLQHLYFGIV